MRHSPHDLPDKTETRIRALVENSAASPSRPRLSIEAEAQLYDVERAAASCYATLEELSFRWLKQARRLFRMLNPDHPEIRSGK